MKDISRFLGMWLTVLNLSFYLYRESLKESNNATDVLVAHTLNILDSNPIDVGQESIRMLKLLTCSNQSISFKC